MIKNVIFDVGNVLVAFCWEKLFQELGFTGEVFEAIADATVRTNEWNEFDRGVMSDEEILSAFIKKAPEYEEQITFFFQNVGRTISQYNYSREFIRALEQKGYRTYILSNFPRRTYQQGIDELSFVEDVSGAIFSYEVQVVKPEKEIYQLLLEKYELDATECVFLDDKRENLVTANQLGMATIQFQSFEQAKEELRSLGVEV